MHISIQVEPEDFQNPDLVAALQKLYEAYSGQRTNSQTQPSTQSMPRSAAAVQAPAVSAPQQSLPQVPTPAAPAVQSSAQVPTAPETQYTMEQLAVAATQLMDSGRQADLVGLLNNFGVQALTALPKEQYGAFATQLRAMGARI